MKLETSEEEREWVRARVDYVRAQGGPFMTDDRVYCDFLTLLAEVERLKADRRPFSDGLAQKVIDEQVKTIDRLTAKCAAGFFVGLTDEQKKAALEYRGPENFGEPRAASGVEQKESAG